MSSDKPLVDYLSALGISETMPGGPARMLSGENVAAAAEHFGMPARLVESAALRAGMIPRRYSRSMQAITPAEQALLLESCVAQVGLGGLGGTLLETLVRSGVGKIKAVDGDSFEESNLNRQALSTMETLGTPKAQAAQERCMQLNPSVEVECRMAHLEGKGFHDLLDGADLAVDALGGLKDREALQQAAAQQRIPLVTGALAGWTGYVATVLPGETGPASIMGTDNSAEETLGCPAPTVTLVASLMASEILAIASGHPAPLAGAILVIDLKNHTFEKISL